MDGFLPKALSMLEEIQRTAAHITALRDAQMREAGLDQERWAVLLAISRSDYCLSISDLARVLNRSRQAAQRMTRQLARTGWIEHLPNVDDRRLLQLFLTPQGKSMIAQIRHRFDASVLAFSAHVNARTLRSTEELLRGLRARMTEFHPGLCKRSAAKRARGPPD